MIYLDDSLTADELRDANRELRGEHEGSPVKTHVHSDLRGAVDALRPYAASQAQLERWADELANYFAVVATGGRVVVWRIGANETIIQTLTR